MSQPSRPILVGIAALVPVMLVALPHAWRLLPLHAAVLATALSVAWRSAAVDHSLLHRPAVRWLLMAGVSAGLGWSLLGGALGANWGVIDDHEIHSMLGPGRDRIPLRAIPSLAAAHPEIGSPSFTRGRYRPTLYLLRLLESAAWGKNVTGWIATRLVLFVVTATLCFDLLRRWLGFSTAGVAVAFFSTLWMWVRIFAAPGPAECYAATGVAAFAWCATAILRSPTPAGAGPWIGLAVAGVFAINAKENFAVLAPVAVVVAVIERRRGRLGAAGLVATGAIAAAAAWVAAVVGASLLANGGRDIYGRPVGLAGFVRSAEGSSPRALRKLVGYGIPLLVATTGMALAWWRTDRSTASRRRSMLAAGAVLGFVALSQFVFYRGEVFRKNHYDLPFVPVVCLLLLGSLVAASTWGRGSVGARRARRRLVVPGVLAMATMALGGDHARHAVGEYAARTGSFSAVLNRLAVACRSEPSKPVRFAIADDFSGTEEWPFSVAAYLRSMGVTNPFFLDPRGLDAGAPAAFTRRNRTLLALSADGGSSFLPWAELPPGPAPITVTFGGRSAAEQDSGFGFRDDGHGVAGGPGPGLRWDAERP